MISISVFKILGKRNVKEELDILLQKGFSRIWVNGEVKQIDDVLNESAQVQEIKNSKESFLVIDRILKKDFEINH